MPLKTAASDRGLGQANFFFGGGARRRPRLRSDCMVARRSLLVAVLMAGSLGSGCTLCKPVVGAVAGPAVLLGSTGGDWGCCCDDGRALAAVLVVAAGIGAGAGLVTGIISDVQAISGAADEPCRNWWHPFATNTTP